jgi:hypothetical protein
LDDKQNGHDPYVFPRWANTLRVPLTIAAALAPLYLAAVVYLAFAPGTSGVGYEPAQPVPYSHELHAGELGIDCRYCHTGVDTGARATIPPTQTCMNCHATVKTESEKLALVRESFATGRPIPWVRVHDLPDYAYFDHSAHVTRGVGCETCHGRVDRMEVVHQSAGLNMGWCLDCHRRPEPHLRPVEEVTTMAWVPEIDQTELGSRLREARNINPPTDCSTCHR